MQPAARVPDHLGRDDRLGDARREVGGRAQLPEVHPGQPVRRVRGASRRRSSICARSRGQFTYEDHQTPWSIVCPNLDLTIGNLPNYHGDGGLHRRHGADSELHADVGQHAGAVRDRRPARGSRSDRSRHRRREDRRARQRRARQAWPEQSYDFESRVQFPRMREIFFADQNWELTGDGDFTGTFHLFKGGHDLSGTFTSDVARRGTTIGFPQLSGSLHWTPTAFDVTERRREVLRRRRRVHLLDRSRSARRTRSTSRFEASVRRTRISPRSPTSSNWPGLRSGRRAGPDTTCSNGRPAGSSSAATKDPPRWCRRPASQTMTRVAGDGRPAGLPERREWGPFAPAPLPDAPADRRGRDVSLHRRRARARAEPVRHRADARHVSGNAPRGASDRASRFTSTSSDWQESDQVLAGLITDFGSPSRRGRRFRRARRVRRRDDRAVPAPARRRRCSPARICARGTRSGATAAAHRRREDDYVSVQRRHRAAGRLGDSRRRPVLARDPA